MNRTLFISFVMFMFLIGAGCSKPETTIIGKWVGVTGSFEFFKDKTGIINPPANTRDLPKNVRFKWNIEGKDNVRMVFDMPVGKVIFAKLEGSKLLIVEEDRFTKQ